MNERRLVADIGGTNARLGLSQGGALEAGSIRSYRNDEFSSFDDVIRRYMADLPSVSFSDAVLAVAGPVHARKAQLTNRNWQFDSDQMSQDFQGRKFSLLNDLAALGQACCGLPPESLETLCMSDAQAQAETQALVIGIGTGFNVSPVVQTVDHVDGLEVEYGHISLPLDVAVKLRDRLGESAAAFLTIEHVFSGRGYKMLSDIATEGSSTDGEATALQREFDTFYVSLLAILTRNLMQAFLPRRGIFFAGGVARHLLTSDAGSAFVDAVRQPFELNTIQTAPVHIILDDAAALKGCASY